MGKIIYIRHGNDQRTRHKYDEKLTIEGKMEARRLAKKLIEEYGLPDVIYYSPFYRTRQTRKEMLKEISDYRETHNIGSKKVILKLEPRLGRFFTKKQRRNPDISSKTLKKGAIIDETFTEFGERVDQHLDEIRKTDYQVIWNITHTLVLLRVSNISHVQYLDYHVIYT